MRFLVHAALGLALAWPTGVAAQADRSPLCSGSLDGETLTTTYRLTDGLEVQGPWRIVANHASDEPNGEGFSMLLLLESIVEVDSVTGERIAVALPAPIQTRFQGEDMDDVVASAARVWCAAIRKAHEGRQGSISSPPVNARARSGL